MSLLMPLQNLPPRATLLTTSISHGPTPICALRFVAGFSRSGRSGANQETTSLHPLHKALCYPHPPSPRSHFQMKLAASCLLGHPSWRHPEPRHCPRCEEGVEAMPYFTAPPVNMLEGPFPRPWTSSPPGLCSNLIPAIPLPKQQWWVLQEYSFSFPTH